jgi:hypothetical protein
VVLLVAVWTANKKGVRVIPPAVLRCGMAEALAHWVKEAADLVRVETGRIVKSVSTATSFACRGRNGDPNAKLSEHAFANAVDISALSITNGKTLALTDRTASIDMRKQLQEAACRRFRTVLGPGSDRYHEDHVHLDLLERRRGYRICQWEVRDAEG